jgi:hypothetical protein
VGSGFAVLAVVFWGSALWSWFKVYKTGKPWGSRHATVPVHCYEFLFRQPVFWRVRTPRKCICLLSLLLTGCTKTAPKPHHFSSGFELSGANFCQRCGRYFKQSQVE